MELTCVILAAGLGTRMKSAKAKVLHTVGGLPMVHHVIRVAQEAGARRVIAVLGHQRAEVQAAIEARFGQGSVEFVEQAEQRGTGHAVMQAVPLLRGTQGGVLILSGDVPLMRASTIAELYRAYEKAGTLAFVTMRPSDPTGYGRVVRDSDGNVIRIVEHRDATPEQRAIREVNAGVYCIRTDFLCAAIGSLTTANAQGEFYLTDLVEQAASVSKVGTLEASPDEVLGINDRVELARADRLYRLARFETFMRNGVTVRDPTTCYIEADVTLERDADIGPCVVLGGKTRVEEGARIESHAVVRDTVVGRASHVGAHVVLVGSTLGRGVIVGPHAIVHKTTVEDEALIEPGAVLIGTRVSRKNPK